jgi:hypothetical protein
MMGRTTSPPTSAHLRARRGALRRLTAWLLVSAAGWISSGFAKNRKEFVCADPDAFGPAERRQRELDNYTESSPDPRATCSSCRFFTATAKPAECGKCQLFNGPANPKGRCDDWTATEKR